MKRTALLHAELSHAIATLGHGDMLVIGDVGLPIPNGPRRIDLALTPGIPTVADVLRVVLEEMQVEKAVIATEAMERNGGQLPGWCQTANHSPGGFARGLQAPDAASPRDDAYGRVHAVRQRDPGGGCDLLRF